ncbi:MAG: hypothetical protein NUV94_03535 [Candidatus Acetothermia bacterium]|jgi:hypothetical protein|nr:hypothetical protein [Candidatus Acetothermia bacterium]
MNLHPNLVALLRDGPRAINLGLEPFAEAIGAQGATVLHVAWAPPPPEAEDLADLLDRLL